MTLGREAASNVPSPFSEREIIMSSSDTTSSEAPASATPLLSGQARSDAEQRLAALPLPVEKLVEYITTHAVDRVYDRISDKEARRFRMLTAGMTLAGVLGLGTVAWIAGLFVDQRVSASTAQATKSLSERLQFEADYQQLVGLALSLENGKSFSTTDRDSVMQLLRAIGKSRFYETRPGFAAYLDRVIDSFFAADLHKELTELDALFRPALASTSRAVAAMTSYFGQAVFGSPLPLDRLEEETAALAYYTTAARTTGWPELYILWNLLFEFQRNGFARSASTDELIAAREQLGTADRQSFERYVFLLRDPTRYMAIPTDEGKRIAERLAKLIAIYPQLEPQNEVSDDRLDEALQNALGGSRADESGGEGSK